MDWNAVLAHLRATHVVAGCTYDWVELWRRLVVDGEHVVQHQTICPGHALREPVALVACEIHCIDPWQALDAPVSVGTIAIEEGRAVLRQTIALTGIEPAHLDRVVDAVAHEAAQLARRLRRVVKLAS